VDQILACEALVDRLVQHLTTPGTNGATS
jgi:hypothetical protein